MDKRKIENLFALNMYYRNRMNRALDKIMTKQNRGLAFVKLYYSIN